MGKIVRKQRRDGKLLYQVALDGHESNEFYSVFRASNVEKLHGVEFSKGCMAVKSWKAQL
jgi:hypothetical protein